ncbi:RHH-type transcriptional regulator, proline utilization regulon repressor [Oryzomicrobium terrae]|uniref:Bifunctional protein PutA n=1 Tax=Oryzomicrobium terrae TaxID=1735038 RepID=A0A5C1E6B9_9RHOO|nr:bifunctional proline dehydrogenase/L-glutamate gamma-semialdehyde dehydrogenase PutA [Oryzomicrobium terrae]QEL64461.1 RHH-type transcriptional regulator, proline utilization regulon repressor [Oryzomicrobium terrae]
MPADPSPPPAATPQTAPSSPDLERLRQAIAALHRRDEAACVAALAAEAGPVFAPLRPAIAVAAEALVTAVRAQRSGASGVDSLMQEFSLSSQEGIALMCLAEALLRIPDQATADRLVRDKIGRGDWQAHLGHSPSLFVNAAAWGLMITGKLIAPVGTGALSGALTRLIARGGEPLVRRGVDFAMRLLGQQFVLGCTIAEALERSREAQGRGYAHSYDMLGEAALTAADAGRYTAAYTAAIHAIGRAAQAHGPRGATAGPGISIKLSALHPRYTTLQRDRVMAELLPRLRDLAALARHYDLGLNIDAEEADRLDLSLDLFTALAADPALADWDGLGFVVQAYQKRAPAVVDYLIQLARHHGRRLMVRLVKGAYWDSEIKRAQVDGLADYPVYTRKAHTDLAYLACARRLLVAAAEGRIYPQFATHNAHTVAAVAALAERLQVSDRDDYEFQCLHGMGETLYDRVAGAARRCRIYAPVGSHETLLPYLVRRLLENGANSSFVHRLVDEAVSVAELVADPLLAVQTTGGLPHPGVVAPAALFAGLAHRRGNSAGLDLASPWELAATALAQRQLESRRWQAAPCLAEKGAPPGPVHLVRNPARRDEVVGEVREASAAEVERALATATAAAPRWRGTAPAARDILLDRAADLLEAERPALFSLAVREAGKTWGNAVAEVREAVDFCRYYAAELRGGAVAAEAWAPYGAGPVVCISPWNFPLAIFVGQISAALAAGHPVIAKPAEQTPLMAAAAVALLHRAGIPRDVLQLLPGPGETVGAALVADPRVAGVVFTGSTEVARLIQASLARRGGGGEVPLIAETGGQNALIVDSSALPEQVVQDVLASAFDSAGQRCSALRVLCLQDEIATPLLAMLTGALQELACGDPADPARDIGPVIDAEAQARLEAHVAALAAAGCPVVRLPLAPECAAGTFVAPTLIEIDRLDRLPGEVFGPVLHVLRYRAAELPQLVAAINATGYGLTFGLHSRIDATVATLTRQVRAGNHYVNRNIVGAVVGVQPFGGEGLSGTGPKAGGPLYLQRLGGARQVAPSLLHGAAVRVTRRDDSALAPCQALAAWGQSLLPAEPAGGAGGREGLIGADGADSADSAEHPDAAVAETLPARCRRYLALSLLPWRLELPGPTGEANTLSFVPRGRVGCVAATADGLLVQLAAVLATGNVAVLADNAPARALRPRLPAALLARVEVATLEPSAALEPQASPAMAGQAPGLAALLVEGPPEFLGAWRRTVAAWPGAIVPVLGPDEAGDYPLYRLVTERVVSINTAAAGGNAALMALGA